LYLPATHATQGPPSGPVYPTLHGQRLVPGTESEFGGQRGHTDAFRQFLNLPASHATHGPTSGPVYPGLQEQALTFVLPNDEFAFAVQLVHAALPFVDLYVPDGHILHYPFDAPVSGPVYPVLHEHPNDGTQLRGRSPAT